MVICPNCSDEVESIQEDTPNVYNPPRLQNLARKRLLRDESLAISALNDLPNSMFPMMFEQAFTDGHTKILTAMILVWPFSNLSVGFPKEIINLDTLKAVLEGLDILISQQFHNRCQLREINWGEDCCDTYGISARSHEGEDLQHSITQMQPMENSSDSGVKNVLKIQTHLELMEDIKNESTTYLLQWAQQRKESIHLCCRKLQIDILTDDTVIDVFKSIHTDCTKELKLYGIHINDLDFLSPYLRQMKNLRILHLKNITGTLSIGDSGELDEKLITFVSELPIFDCLNLLYVHNVSFIKGNLEECLRFLKKPLETLCITDCDLSQSDLDCLPYCLNVFELRYLHLSVPLHNLLLEPLVFFFERVRHTLEILILKSCNMGETHFNALLPAISQCSKLMEINFCDNELSLASLKQLLHHTANMRQLSYEYYPAPLECYNDEKVILKDKLETFGPELLDILRVKRQPEEVMFVTPPCSLCGWSFIYDVKAQGCMFIDELSEELLWNTEMEA